MENNQLSTTNGKGSKPSIVNALETGNKQELALILNSFKGENGILKYDALLAIPTDKRLPAMFKANPQRATTLVAVGLQMAFESMNLARPINPAQIFDLAGEILDSSKEDFLSLQDVMLFLQGLTRGKYGPLYESMDVPKFMEKFEIYRQTRHVEYLKIQDTQHLQFKGLGPSERSTQYDPLAEAAYNMAGRMNELKTKLKEQREINNRK